MDSPVYYIIVAMMLASVTLSIIFYLAWKTFDEQPYALSWSVAFFAAACQWFFNLQQSWFSNYIVYWLVVNAFALALVTLGIRGHCQRTNCELLPKNLWPFCWCRLRRNCMDDRNRSSCRYQYGSGTRYGQCYVVPVCVDDYSASRKIPAGGVGRGDQHGALRNNTRNRRQYGAPSRGWWRYRLL